MNKDLRVNWDIRAKEVRVIGPNGEQLGVLGLRDGMRIAQEANLDLVEVAPQARPPVCKIMDFGKFKYEQSKKDREAKKKQKVITIKEVRMSPKIDDHDMEVKSRNSERFLREGAKVKVSVRFKGREIVHADLTRKLLLDMAQQLTEVGIIEQQPRVEGRHMIMVLAPRNQTAQAG